MATVVGGGSHIVVGAMSECVIQVNGGIVINMKAGSKQPLLRDHAEALIKNGAPLWII